ncbi:hypothetical protein [Comamonas fluminis]|nr:hypothetical protein [Comamonas fluminis]
MAVLSIEPEQRDRLGCACKAGLRASHAARLRKRKAHAKIQEKLLQPNR